MPAPLPPLRDLCVPEPGSETAYLVLSRAIARLVAEVGPATGDAAFAAVLRRIASASPGALASALRRPTVATLVRCLRSGPDAALSAELRAQLAFELMLGGALPERVPLTPWPARLLSPAARVAVALPSDAHEVVVSPGGVEVTGPRGSESLGVAELRSAGAADAGPSSGAGVALPGDAAMRIAIERPYAPIQGRVVLALADNNPLASIEAHPDKSGNRIDLGGHPVADWCAALDEALTLVAEYLPGVMGEIDLFVEQVVPVGWDAERHLSASYQEAIGTLYLSLHPSPLTLAEAIVHEHSHGKLNALFELDPVLEGGGEASFVSPVRPDPRPLQGVLLAVHAFLPVERLLEALLAGQHPLSRPPAFAERLAAVRRANREGADVLLQHARPTSIGRALLEEIRAACAPERA